MKTTPLPIFLLFLVSLLLSGCFSSNESVATSFSLHLTDSFAGVEATAGIEFPNIFQAFNRPENATAVTSVLGELMQKDYKSKITASMKSLAKAEADLTRLTSQEGFPKSVKADFETYSAILHRNEVFFSTTDPLSHLQQWFNGYQKIKPLYEKMIDATEKHSAGL